MTPVNKTFAQLYCYPFFVYDFGNGPTASATVPFVNFDSNGQVVDATNMSFPVDALLTGTLLRMKFETAWHAAYQGTLLHQFVYFGGVSL